jgi:DnaB-like helicase C terminal domain
MDLFDSKPEHSPAGAQLARVDAWADIERVVVKAALSAGVRRVSDLQLRGEELSDRRCREVWSAVLRMIDRGARSVWLDGSLVAEVATAVPIDQARAAIEWIRGARDEAEDAAVDALVCRLRDRLYCARVYELASRLRSTVETATTDNATRAGQTISELRDLTESRHSPGVTMQLQGAVEAFDSWVATARSESVSGKAARFGIEGIDRWIRMDAGTITVVGAESHIGKSGLAAEACLATARAGVGATFLSLEDPWGELVGRAAAGIGGFNPEEVRSEQPSFDLQERLRLGRMGLVGLPLSGIRIPDRSVDTTIAFIHQAAARGSLLVALDYAQALRRPIWAPRNATRRDWFDEALGAIFAAASDRGVHLMLLSQLTRDKDRKQVTKHDLRESSTLGDAARNILAFWAEGEGEDRKVIGLVEKAKGTQGAGKRVKLVRDRFGVLREEAFSNAAEF